MRHICASELNMQMSGSFVGIGMALVNIKLWEWVSIFFAHAYTTILFFYSKSLHFAEASLIAYYIMIILISWSKQDAFLTVAQSLPYNQGTLLD